MLRLNLVLLLAVMASAIFLVHNQYESRRLATEQQRLQVEKRAQATPQRIEVMARERLQMKPATPAIAQYVNDDARTGVAP